VATAQHDTGTAGSPSKCSIGLALRPALGSVTGVHPIERLRAVARSGGLGLDELVQDAAMALAGFADDPAGLVTACRSLVDRHPAAGPIWSLCARALVAADPAEEAWRVVEEAEADDTASALYRAVPDGAQVLVVGWSESLATALGRRGDCRLLVADAAGRCTGGLRGRLRADVEEVPDAGIGAAAAHADLVLFEAQAMGGDGLVAVRGARAASAVAAATGRPVWVVAPAGRVLPGPLWEVVAARLSASPEPWLEPDEIVPVALVAGVVRATGLLAPADALAQPDCPFAPELVRRLDAPGSHR